MSDVSCKRQEFLLRSQDWHYMNQEKIHFLATVQSEVVAVNSRISTWTHQTSVCRPRQKLLARECERRAGERDERKIFNLSLMSDEKWPTGSWLVTTWTSPDTEKLALRPEVWPGKWGNVKIVLDRKYSIKIMLRWKYFILINISILMFNIIIIFFLPL